MATRARAARLLTLDAAAAFDRGERCDMVAGMAKYLGSEAALENSIEGMRIHGAYGYSQEYDIERLYRLAEGLAHLRVFRRQLECTLGNTDATRGDVDPSELETSGV